MSTELEKPISDVVTRSFTFYQMNGWSDTIIGGLLFSFVNYPLAFSAVAIFMVRFVDVFERLKR